MGTGRDDSGWFDLPLRLALWAGGGCFVVSAVLVLLALGILDDRAGYSDWEDVSPLLVVGFLGSVALGIVVRFVVARTVAGPLLRMADAMRSLGDAGRLADHVSPSGSELRGLVVAVDASIADLREVPQRLEHMLYDTLETSSKQLSRAVERLTVTATEQNQTVTRQAAALHEAQATMQQIKQTSLMAAQKAETVLQVAERADDVSRSGEMAIEESLSALTGIRAQVDSIAHKIAELSERTRQIGLITETVKDMADQSNMLALNAAIEAVRSGEHGKGFAVVAREIRSLADQSIQATDRVREILEDISSAIRKAVSITEAGAKQMEGGLEQVNVSGAKLRELSSMVKDNAAAVRQIAAAVSQQNAGVTQIFEAVSDLNDMMEDTVMRLEETNVSVDGLRDVSDRVSTILTDLRTEPATEA